jgi:hypothetical protein
MALMMQPPPSQDQPVGQKPAWLVALQMSASATQPPMKQVWPATAQVPFGSATLQATGVGTDVLRMQPPPKQAKPTVQVPLGLDWLQRLDVATQEPWKQLWLVGQVPSCTVALQTGSSGTMTVSVLVQAARLSANSAAVATLRDWIRMHQLLEMLRGDGLKRGRWKDSRHTMPV